MDTAAVRTTVPAAASSRAPDWLSGPDLPARVLTVSESAAYLLPADSAADGATPDVLALVGQHALRLPGAVLVPGPGDLAVLGLRTGATVTVGGGRVHAPGALLEVRRTWPPRPVPPGPWSRAAELLGVLDSIPLRPGREDLDPLAADALRDPVCGVPALVGLGPGLTPSGDDVLCGALLVLGAEPGAAVLHRALAGTTLQALPSTTALSATLVRAAVDGYAVPPVLDLLAAARGQAGRPGGTADLVELATAVTRIGHSSGSDLLVGVRAALQHLLVPVHPSIPSTTREA